jgi:hypothetical protein
MHYRQLLRVVLHSTVHSSLPQQDEHKRSHYCSRLVPISRVIARALLSEQCCVHDVHCRTALYQGEQVAITCTIGASLVAVVAVWLCTTAMLTQAAALVLQCNTVVRSDKQTHLLK